MATKRFGYLDDLSLKNTNVGIGTSTPTDKIEVVGGTRSKDIVVTGIATLTSYEGFLNKNTSYTGDVIIDSGESGTLSGEVVVGSGLTMTVGTGATTGQGSIDSLKVSNTFTPPIGGINDRPSAPQPGALYYNKDFRTIEYWDGNFWRQVDNTTRSGRAVTMGGYTGSTVATMDYITISTLGNAKEFGELNTNARTNGGGIASRTRGISAGGIGPSGVMDEIQYITIASAGNAIDFGNLLSNCVNAPGVSSQTRGIVLFGETPSASNVIQYIEISTTGNAVDFGDTMTVGIPGGNAGCGSPTRGLVGGHQSPTSGIIEAITIASKGNSIRFGELSQERYRAGGLSNSTRGVWGGGNPDNSPVNHTNTMDYVTIASDGNAIDFGDIMRGTSPGSTSSSTRGILAGGYDNTSSPTAASLTNIINYITLSTLGDAMDFGDLSEIRGQVAVVSDSHGGLGGY